VTMSSIVLFLRRAIWEVGPMVEEPRAAPAPAEVAAPVCAVSPVLGAVLSAGLPNRLLVAVVVVLLASAVEPEVAVAAGVALLAAACDVAGVAAPEPNNVAALGAEDPVVAAGFPPNNPPAEVVAGVDDAGAVVAAGVDPKRPPLAGAGVDAVVAAGEFVVAGLAPKRELGAALASLCAPAAGGWVAVAPSAGVEDADAGFEPNRPPEELPAEAKRLDTGALVVSWGGAPAGVVEARENRGLAGVAILAADPLDCVVAEAPPPKREAEVGAWVLGAALLFWPKRPPPAAGVVDENSEGEAAAGACVVAAAAPLLWPPKSPPPVAGVVVEAPPPNRPEAAGLLVALALFPPKRPPAAAGVLEPLPKSPPAGAGVVVDVGAAGLLPKRLEEVEGVEEPPKRPPPGDGAADAPPNKPLVAGAALFSVALLLAVDALFAAWPNNEGVLAGDWVWVLLAALPKLKVGVLEAVALPKRPPEAGAVALPLLAGALPLVDPKLKPELMVGT
jgi:hypothetical protein